MKFLILVVALMFIHCCAAQQSSRSSMWLLANTNILRNGSTTSQRCFITGATGVASPVGPVTLLTTSNLVITGTFVVLSQADADAGFVTSHSVLYTVSIQFIYNSTYSITLAIPVQGTSATPNHLTVSNVLSLPWWTSSVSSSTTNTFPVVTTANTVLSPTGSTWLKFQNIPAVYVAAAATAPPAQTAASSGIVITDYISLSTIAVTLWNDNSGASTATTGTYNAFYQLGIRTKTSTISSSSSTLTTATGCAASRKRSVDHLIKKRTALTTCTSTTIDPSMPSSVISTVCSGIDTNHAATTGSATETVSDLNDAVNKGVIAMNALYREDLSAFSAGGSKFAIAANFGMLIALSSIIFSFFN